MGYPRLAARLTRTVSLAVTVGAVLLSGSPARAQYPVSPRARITFGSGYSLNAVGGALQGRVLFYGKQGLEPAAPSGRAYVAGANRLELGFYLQGECQSTSRGLLLSGVQDLNPNGHRAELRVEMPKSASITAVKVQFENQSSPLAIGGILALGAQGENWYTLYSPAGKVLSETLTSAQYRGLTGLVLRGNDYNSTPIQVVNPAIGEKYIANRVEIIRFECYGLDQYLIKAIDLLW